MARRVATQKSGARWASYVVLSALVWVTWFAVGSVRLAKVPSGSMEPTLVPGDVMMMRIDAYRHRLPARGDLVIFRDPSGDGDLLVKRVIGLPGEDVVVQGGVVWVDGRLLKEPYVKTLYVSAEIHNTVLKDHELWVMGDNRTNSEDSRDFGPIDTKRIVGRGAGIIWPLDRRTKLLSYNDKQ